MVDCLSEGRHGWLCPALTMPQLSPVAGPEEVQGTGLLESRMLSHVSFLMPDKEVVSRLVQEGKGGSAVQRLVSMEERWAYAYSMRKLIASPFRVRH